MKLKIKVKVLTPGCMPVLNDIGDWIDLRSAVDIDLPAPQSKTLRRVTQDGKEVCYRDVILKTYYVPLGVAMELPKGFEAPINSRSSGPKKLKIFIPNGQGLVDYVYNGDNDEWNYICSPMESTSIKKGDRICQFRIQLSQKATVWQKLKWFLCSGVELVRVDSLNNEDRGGLGSSGVK